MGIPPINCSSDPIYGRTFDLERVLNDKRESLLVANGSEWKNFLLKSNSKILFQLFWFRLVDLETSQGNSEPLAAFLAEILSFNGGKLPFDLNPHWVPFVSRLSGEFVLDITQKLNALEAPLTRDCQWLNILIHLPEEDLSRMFLKGQKSQTAFLELWNSFQITSNTIDYDAVRRRAFDSIHISIRQNPKFYSWYKISGVKFIDYFMIAREKLIAFYNHPLHRLFLHLMKFKSLCATQFFEKFKNKFLSNFPQQVIFDPSPIAELQKIYVNEVMVTFLRIDRE